MRGMENVGPSGGGYPRHAERSGGGDGRYARHRPPEPRPPVCPIGCRVNQKDIDEKSLCNDLSKNGRVFYQALDKLNSCIRARFEFYEI